MRTNEGISRAATLIGLVLIALFAMGLPALAADGPTPPEVSDPISGNTSPHGGYSDQTDYCLQCHQVHYDRLNADAPGEYALMAQSSVTATCATCHSFAGDPTSPPGDPFDTSVDSRGDDFGTASTRAVYNETNEVHVIGAGFGTVGRTAGWDFYVWTGQDGTGIQGPKAPSGTSGSAGTASYYNGGLYCGSCHTPHGEFGQLINSKWAVTTATQGGGLSWPTNNGVVPVAARQWTEGTRIWWKDPTPASIAPTWGVPQNADPTDPWKQVYLHQGDTYWQVCGTQSGILPGFVDGSSNCEPAQVKDSEDQLVSLYGYKLLTSSPNHQYPVRNATGQYLQSDGTTYGATPVVGLYSDAPFIGGTVSVAGSPNFITENTIGALTFDIGPVATSIDVDETASFTAQFTASPPTMAVPFKIRIDDEVMMVTGRTAPVAPSTTATYTTVQRGVEPVDPETTCRPWGPTYSAPVFTKCAGIAHTQTTEVLLVPTILVNETLAQSVADTAAIPPSTSGRQGGLKPIPAASYSSTQTVKTPFHIKVDNEMMTVLWRTQVSGSQYLYTVGRGVDKTSGVAHTAGTNFFVQSGVNRNSIRSWGVDRYDSDMSNWCGSCHSGPVDVKFGGQYHSHPTGCVECHGSSSSAGYDFPHSTNTEFLLKNLPDGLCINCHVPGTLP